MSSIAYALLWAFVFAVPWENIVLLPGIGTVGRLLGLIAAPVGIVAILMRGRLRPLSTFHILAACYVLWAGLTIVWSLDQGATLLWTRRVVQSVALPWLIWELAGTSQRRVGLLQAYVLGAYVSSISTFLAYRSGIARFTGRFTAEGFNPNELGFLLGLALPMAWYLSVTNRNLIFRWINRLYIPVGSVAVLLTGSRSSLITMLIGLAIIPLTMKWMTRKMKLGAVGVAVALITAVVLYVPPRTWARMSTISEEIESGTLNQRRTIWSAGLELFPRHPIGGVGAGAFATAVQPFLGNDKTPHNTYISVLIEEGIVGLTLFTLMLMSLFFHVRASRGLDRRFSLILLLMVLVGMLPRTAEHAKMTWVIFGLLLIPAGSPGLVYFPGVSPGTAPIRTARAGRVGPAAMPSR